MQFIREKDIYICPTLQWYAVGYGQYGIDEMLSQRGMEFISSEIKADWAEKSKEYRAKLGSEKFQEEKEAYAKEMQERLDVVLKLEEQGTKLLISPDSSSKFIVPGFGLLEEMKLYQKAGLTNQAILKSATLNFAHFFNENYGVIGVGKDADFILTIKNPLENIKALENIAGLFYNGNYINKEQLDEFLKKTTGF
ncbi:MAG: amidohydrolase family protein [Capnocytophaga sp.]|nr:amidohydrolase family protein [Capnocytophaga sp.]